MQVDEDTKWKTRILRRIHSADPVAVVRKSCLYSTLYWNIVLWHDFLPIPTGSAV